MEQTRLWLFVKFRELKGVTFGNVGLYRALIVLLRHVNIKVLYYFMYIFVIPVTMVVSRGARITFRYFRKQREMGWWKSLVSTYRNHCVFGQTVIDKFAMYAGHKFKVTLNGFEQYKELVAKDEALIQLNAHVGCSEILGYSCSAGKPCNVLVFGGEKASLMHYRKASFGDMNIRMIPVGVGDSHSDEIIDALDRKEIVCAFADRYMNEKKVVRSTIQGKEVLLARGPFSLAVTRGIDVVMVSAMKERDGSYTAFFTPLHYDKSLTKTQQRQQLADAYTAEIERLLKMYPMQWFNYV